MTTPPTDDATRHRLLDGVLLRLAGRPDVDAFVVRGGVLMRHWFRPVPRPADDLDLIATFPFDVEETVRRVLPILADDEADGVAFDVGRAHVERIGLDTGPAVRFFVAGTADAEEVDLKIDVTFGRTTPPAPVLGELPTATGTPARVWASRPEAVVGHKVQALCHRGMVGWRAKDLDDLHLLLCRVPMDATTLRDAVAAHVADAGATVADARGLFGPGSWWGLKVVAARWRDYVNAARRPGVPRDLAAVVAKVAERLVPILEGVA